MRLSEKMDRVYVGCLIQQDRCYLVHHGIKGQKWGHTNGPPYPLDKKVSDRIKKMKSVGGGDKKVDSHDTATMAKYRTTDRWNRMLRASNNGVIGQKLAVRLNKGYREDRAKIKAEYKAGKKELNKKAENYKEQKKALKDAYKESKTDAATKAADAIYGKQSHELNRAIQSEKVGKAYLRNMFMGDYGSLAYMSSRVNDAAGRVTSAYIASLANSSVNGTTKHAKSSSYVKNVSNKDYNPHERFKQRANEQRQKHLETSRRRAALVANSYLYSQTGVSKEDRQKVAEYRKAQKEAKKRKR